MSWRDRVARHDPPDRVVAATPAQEAIGTIGTIGEGVLSTTTDHAGEKKKVGSDDDSSPDVVRDALAVSVNSAVRAGTPHFGSSLDDAISAESANRTDDGRELLDEAKEERAGIVEHDGKIPRDWRRGSPDFIPTGHRATCRRSGGSASSTTWGCSSTVLSVLSPRRSAGDPTTCSAATAIGHMRGSTKPACSGSSTATGWWH
jgi:hypothetical protein